MPVHRLLHLSDLHLAAGTNRARYKITNARTGLITINSKNALEALAKFVHTKRTQLDAILISGDLGVTGDVSDLSCAIEFLQSPPGTGFHPFPWLTRKNKATINFFSPKEIIILPGNHDRFLNLHTAWPGTEFYNIFRSYWEVGVGGIKSTFLPNRTKPTLAIICCDFTLNDTGDAEPTWGRWGQGKVRMEILDALEKKTKKIRGDHPSCAVLWAIHFAPFYKEYFKDDEMDIIADAMVLQESKLLSERAQELEINRILCGHTHRVKEYSFSDDPKVTVYCAGTSTCSYENYKGVIHIRNIKTEEDRIVSIDTEDYAYTKAKGRFHKIN